MAIDYLSPRVLILICGWFVDMERSFHFSNDERVNTDVGAGSVGVPACPVTLWTTFSEASRRGRLRSQHSAPCFSDGVY